MKLRLGLAAAALLFLALAAWQFERRVWKLALIERVEARAHAAPSALPADFDAARDEYRRVSVTGRFERQHSVQVQAVTEQGAGFWLLTPLRLSNGSAVLVNRGFVPPRWQAPVEPDTLLTLTGLLRVSEPSGAFLRSNDPAAGRWYSRDVQAIADARGLGKVAPFFIDAEAATEGPPIGGLTVIRFANNHLVYALTWLALVVMSVGGALMLQRRG
ncbi:MAG TPA: SURF1 family protein [Burkholderiaceae bacterium]